ncbi:EF-hand domain-containing protein [Lysobacter niabensis]|uniref:EF-hand domain-containing protein n=1 Tax=Agrilutibacter niabensis TaxID=380628 RepID=UPI00360F99A2
MTHITHKRMRMALLSALVVSAPAWAGNPDASFKSMDGNGDGMVSSAEHAQAVQQMFAGMDANHDGNVTAAEMDARHAMHGDKEKAARPAGGMSSADKIARMDTNGDGMLSASEHEAGAQSMFSEMDTDGDGSLSRQEVAAAHATMKSGKTTP